MDIFVDIKEIMKKINDVGKECYLVGGFVRDSLLMKENHDYDFCTNIPFNELKKIFPDLVVMKENDHRNTAVIMRNNKEFEFTLFKGNDLYEDLFHRDFTINSIAVDANGKIFDPFGGVNDINKKILRNVNDNCFDEDPLRILRCIRFASKYNFEINEKTVQLMLQKKHLLNCIAPERVYSELQKILISPNVSYYFNKYRDIFFEIIPELKECYNFNQHNDYHIYDVYNHTLSVIENSPPNYYVKLAALFHDIGKPRSFTIDDKGIGHFYGHAKRSLEIFEKFSKKYKIDNKTHDIVADLILFHEDELSIKNSKIFKFYKKYKMEYVELLFDLKLADIKGQNPKYINRIEKIKELKNKYLEIRKNYNEINYSGSNLVQKGITGKNIGMILENIKFQIINNQLKNNINDIDSYVNKFIEQQDDIKKHM